MRKILALFIILFCVNSCQESPIETESTIALNLVTDSGITFINKLTNLSKHNALVYETFFNGGGVAVGDINNDGLDDIYFAGNQVADQLYLNKGHLKFEDISIKSGILNDGSWSTGVTMVDINNDGLLDIYVCKSLYDERPELRRNKLYINQGNSFFVDKASEYGLADMWRTQEAVFFDYDNDQDLDVLMVNQPPNPGLLSSLKGQDFRVDELGVRLLENRDLQFYDITDSLELNHPGYALSASVADFNNDGWQDIFIAHDYNAPDRLFINQKGKKFINTANQSFSQISFFSMGTDAADINNDGFDDIISLDMVSADPYRNKANMGGMNPEAFWRNVDNGGHYQYMFNAVQISAGVLDNIPYYSNQAMQFEMAKTDWSWSPLIADFDNDGFNDIFISNGIKRDLRYTDGVNEIQDSLFGLRAKGWSQEDLFNKINFKPLLEKLPSQEISNYLYKNNKGQSFTNISKDWSSATKGFSSGAAISDLDNDGDLDLIINNVDAVAQIFENASTQNNYVRIIPKLSQDQLAIGARVIVEADGQTFTSQLKLNRGFYSSSEGVVHIGLGQIQSIDRIKLIWDDNSESSYTDVQINKELVIIKGENQKPYSNGKSSFADITDYARTLGLEYQHKENDFDDFQKQVLLPHKIGVNAAQYEVVDLNEDKVDDILVIGGVGQSIELFESKDGKFERKLISSNLINEATSIESFDIDNDGDLDFYVTNGGNAKPDGDKFYQNYFLLNEGAGNLVKIYDKFTQHYNSDALSLSYDVNNDGFQDLLVFSRLMPGNYPLAGASYCLLNNSNANEIQFTVDHSYFDFETLGMVQDAGFADLDGDGDNDLMIVGEWMPIHIYINNDQQFEKKILEKTLGWWFELEFTDFNEDGLTDILLGNLGENVKYKTSSQEPFKLYFDDIDNNQVGDIVLAYSKKNKSYPVRGRSCSSEQIPGLKEKFPSYHEFALADVDQIYEGENLRNQLIADNFSSGYLTNMGGFEFEWSAFPFELQQSNIWNFVSMGKNKYLAVGNLETMEIETPKLDASYGTLFRMDKMGKIQLLKKNIHPIFNKHIESIKKTHIGSNTYLTFIPLNGNLHFIDIKSLE